MGAAISRFQFLRGDFSGSNQALRPPWAVAEPVFVAACSRCGDCVRACPQQLLSAGRGGYPELSFANAECTFCGDCARACAPAALDARLPRPWTLVASIGDTCLTRRGVECRACADPCEVRAIRFRLRVGGPAHPELDPADCNGCGACYGSCPAGAIQMQSLDS